MQKHFRILFVIVCMMSAKGSWSQWQAVPTSFTVPRYRILSIDVINASTVWAVADTATFNVLSHRILRTTNAGATWNISTVPTFIAEVAFDISAIDNNTAWVTTNPLQFGDSTGGGVYKTTDGGANWEKQLSIKSVFVYFFNASNGVMVNTTRVFTTSNGGANWIRTTNIPPYDADEFNIVASLNNSRAAVGDTIWIATNRGRVFRSTNLGRDWTASVVSFGRGFLVTTLAFRDSRNGLAISSDDSTGTLSSTKASRTTDGGTTWQTIPPPSGFTVRCITAVPGTSGTYVIVGSAYSGTSGSAYTTNNGDTWTPIDSGIRYNAVEFISPTIGWVGGLSIAPTELMYKWTGNLLVPPGIVRRVPAQYATIQSAINACSDRDTVLVAEGTYFENIKYRGKKIVVGSQFLLDGDTAHIARTIINGGMPTHPDSGSVVTFSGGEDSTSALVGFTITGGIGTLLNERGIVIRGGAGILSTSSALIRRNRIIENTLITTDPNIIGFGAGIFHLSSSSSPGLAIIADNLVANNSVMSVQQLAGGGITAWFAPARIVGNIISNNSLQSTNAAAIAPGVGIAYAGGPSIIRGNRIIANRASSPASDQNNFGGGIFVQQSPVVIEENTVANNSLTSSGTLSSLGGGICIFRNADTASTVLRRNIINGNSTTGGSASRGGGVYVLGTTTNVENNLIIKNRSTRGGGIAVIATVSTAASGSEEEQGFGVARFGIRSPAQHVASLLPSPQFINNTIAYNFASDGGGGFYASTANPIIMNSILWGDTATSEIFPVSSSVDVVYSNVQNGWTGEGNIDANPLFTDTLGRISSISPCNNAGVDSIQILTTLYRSPRTDLFGNPRPRPVGTSPDIGSHELQTSTAVESAGEIPNGFALLQNYPNPFNPTTEIKFSVAEKGRATLEVFNILGQKVETLFDDVAEAGRFYNVKFNASNFASGVYLYRLESGRQTQVRRLLLLR